MHVVWVKAKNVDEDVEFWDRKRELIQVLRIRMGSDIYHLNLKIMRSFPKRPKLPGLFTSLPPVTPSRRCSRRAVNASHLVGHEGKQKRGESVKQSESAFGVCESVVRLFQSSRGRRFRHHP